MKPTYAIQLRWRGLSYAKRIVGLYDASVTFLFGTKVLNIEIPDNVIQQIIKARKGNETITDNEST